MASPDKAGSAARHLTDAKRVTWAGLGINLFLAGLKITCGILGHSQAVIAAAVHTLSDCATDIMLLIGIPFWTAPADQRHPHGHRRIETVVTLVIAVLLALSAFGFGYQAVGSIREEHIQPPGWIAFYAALVSIAGKEFLYRWTVRVGKRIKSPALVANAWEHRADGFSAIPVALAVAGAHIGREWIMLDHIGAIIVSLFILRAAWTFGAPALAQLVDAGAPERVLSVIEKIVLDTDGVERVHAIRTRYIGSGLQVDLHIWADGDLSIREGHHISEVVKEQLLKRGPDLVDVVVHLEPCESQNRRKRVLFLCTGNSCRSQMAEGWARELKADEIRAYSAGVEPHPLDHRAVAVMAEAGVDISGQRSKHVSELKDIRFDCVVTVCDSAREQCPVLPGKTVKAIHAAFDDPPALAANARTEDEAMQHYRRVRDEIGAFVDKLPDILSSHASAP